MGFYMSKELNKWAQDLLSSLNASKYKKQFTCLPAEPDKCAKALRYITAKNKWKIKVSVRGDSVCILVGSKAKKTGSSRPTMVERVKSEMLTMKPREMRRFCCLPNEISSARGAVYKAKEQIGGRFSTSTSKDGVLLIIRG